MPGLPTRPLRAVVCHLPLDRKNLAPPVSLQPQPPLPSRLINARLRARKAVAHLNLWGWVSESIFLAIEVKIVISHGWKSSGSQTAVNEYFFLDSIEMTGGVVLERQGSIHHVHKQQKIRTSQTYVPDASIRPTTLARQNEEECLQ